MRSEPNIRVVRQLFCHPVKGLTASAIPQAELRQDWGMQGDRLFALMFDDLDYSPTPNLPWLPKRYFAVQNDWPDLARVQCHYDLARATLQLECNDQPTLVAHIDRDRAAIGAWFSQFLQTCQPTIGARHPQHATLELVGESSGLTGFRDRRAGQISIIGSATLDVLATQLNTSIDPRRFRPNVILDTVEPWEEFDWIGRRLRLGSVELEAIERIERCLNIEVCPDSGQRDLPLLATLKRHFRHTDTGIIARVTQGGMLAVNQPYNIL
ncbi:MAG: MOSC domain-containing protein [Oscillatoriales cyanobacterium]|nr:MAG: MOSC domain-containing protein [Oscillatoriales cyanobacterium]